MNIKMISFLPKVYKDELLYSVIGRYHKYSGEKNIRHTMREFFDTANIIPTLEFQSHLNNLAGKLNSNMLTDVNEIIENNTLIPLYEYFTTKENINKIKEMMINSDGKAIKYKLGMIRGGICKKDYICYCPICSKEEFEIYGEAYIHRTHQVQGNLVCEKHACLLKQYIFNSMTQEYIVFNEKNMNFDIEYPDKFEKEKLIRISQGIHFLLNSNCKKYYINDIKSLYNFLIYKKGLANKKGIVSQKELVSQFIDYYGTSLLERLESDIDKNNKFNWLSCIVRKHSKTFHPIRHILFIDFLCENVNDFINKIEINDKLDIKRNWLCLNSCCKNYKRPVIKDYEIIMDSKSKGTIGLFKCECGFVYSRRISADLNCVPRIRCYGHVWEDRLRELVNSGMSIRAIAREMICDPTTVVKYAEKLGIKQLLNTKRKNLYKLASNVSYESELKNIYRNELNKIILVEPNISRNNARAKIPKEYKWLNRNDKEWLEKILPKVTRSTNGIDYKKYWKNKDNETLLLVKNAYNILINLDRPIRITKSLIGTETHKRALLTNQINKMPRTQEFLELVCESIEEFRFRRLDKIYEYINQDKIEIPEWKVLRMASIKDKSILIKYNLLRSKNIY